MPLPSPLAFGETGVRQRIKNALRWRKPPRWAVIAAALACVLILAVCAAAKQGAVFTDIRRLRLKESDRVASVIAMLEGLGGKAEAGENTLTVYGTGLLGGTVNSMNDHRIAMATAIAATVCKETVNLLGAEAVNKSYPRFWEDYAALKGDAL